MLLPATACAAGDPAYLSELQARAKELRLSQHPQWHSLLHYQPNWILPGVSSLVDSGNFFVAPEGKSDPVAELHATLASFFSDQPRNEEPAQCRLKARYEWLKTLLRFDPQRLPPHACERFEAWYQAIDPGSLSMVFASSELSSPATMFGHTLMRLDGRSLGPDQKLLSNAINYAAVYDDAEDSLLYTVRGIAGGYIGVFTMSPYYEKVNEYARIESRDLWEYPLQLDPSEIQRLLWHLWEMREVEFDYYFFSENCSYQLLSLLDVARPDLRLLDTFPRAVFPHVIPLDTVRVLKRAGLLGTPAFRPALAHRLQHALAQLAPEQYDWVLAYAGGRATLDEPVLTHATAARRVAMLDAAHDYLYYRFQDEDIARDIGLPRAQQTLLARSRITERSDLAALPRPDITPEDGHGSGRYSAGVRTDRHGTAMVLRTRDALHDLLDPPRAYLTGGQIEFFNIGALVSDDGVRLLDVKLAGVQAAAPWDRAFRPWSWFASTGARRYGLDALAAKPRNSLGFYGEGGGGITWAPSEAMQVFGYAETQFDANPSLRDSYSLSGGARAGASMQWMGRWTSLLEAQWLTPIAGGGAHQVYLRSGLQWQWTARLGLRASVSYGRSHKESLIGSELLANYYF